ncbi:Ribosomal RNA large subunit methyltransferase I [bioreactor metagenome]|uniref:Ribosomal RNA large subunit methyltransferase I n=1 Tax=bioreactor metagenome TaxID=1076179 RepID=A0A644XVY1_9ZZZZ
MKQRDFPQLTVTRKAQAGLEAGHPWVYDMEVLTPHQEIESGTLVDVVSDKQKYLGTGFISQKSKIRIRLISQNTNDVFDRAFFKRRISYAWEYRKTVMPDDLKACRIIFGEADQFPGLTVDRYNDILVAQTLSIGIEKHKDLIFPLLYEVLTEDGQQISGIYERNDVSIRDLEGLPQFKGWYKLPNIPTPSETATTIIENHLNFIVDFDNGQKTGYFLDQKYNRAAVARIAKDKTVLDCFTHTGSFAIHASYGQAKKVTAVDVSAAALEIAQKNAELNQITNVSFVISDVLDLLRKMEVSSQDAYDLIILDPPAFTKSRRTIENALKGYQEINSLAMKILPRGGYLATCSCSHFVTDEMFRKMLKSAARDAAVSLRQIEGRQQSPDHPILWSVPETDYLKFYLFQII